MGGPPLRLAEDAKAKHEASSFKVYFILILDSGIDGSALSKQVIKTAKRPPTPADHVSCAIPCELHSKLRDADDFSAKRKWGSFSRRGRSGAPSPPP